MGEVSGTHPFDALRSAAARIVRGTDVTMLDQQADAFSLVYLGHVVHVQRIGSMAVVHWPHGEPTSLHDPTPATCGPLMGRAVQLLLS